MDAINTEKPHTSLLDIVKKLKSQGMQCNCDLDNWSPERDTGHSWVCRIHKAAKSRIAAINVSSRV